MPCAVDALLTVTFRVPDTASTTDISNRSKLALVSIGEPAVPRLKEMLAGKFTEVNELANKHDVDLLIVQQTAVGILGAMGTSAALDELIAFMPQSDCVPKPAAKPDKKKKKKDEEDEPTEEEAADASLRSRELPRSPGQLAELVGRMPLKDIVGETTDLIEQLCIETALKMTSDNRASAAQMLGLSRQSLYVKLRRHGIGDLGDDEA